MHHTPIAAGGSSFDLIDSKKLFAEMKLKQGMTFLDVACGNGYYSIAALKYVGETGIVYAVDLWNDGIEHLSNHIKEHNISNIQPILADARKMIPLKSSRVDISLLSTVLHDFMLEKTEDGVLKEIHRVLKPAGKFAVVEYKKIASRRGPPIEIRITPDRVRQKVLPYGFEFLKTVEISELNYLSLFERVK
jgi:ubiquinone/menaquinone biosynthesis C-methylase UbiE